MANKSGAIGQVGAALGGATSFTGLGGVLGIGGMLAGLFGGDDEGNNTNQLQEQINAILNGGLKNALGYSQTFTNKAVGQTNQSLQSAIDAITGYNTKAQQAALGAAQGGQQYAQNIRAPYTRSGYNALDAYQKTLGLATPEGGSYNYIQNQQKAQQLKPLLQALNGQYSATAPVNPTLSSANSIVIDPATRQRLIQQVVNNKGVQQTAQGLNVAQLLNNNADINSVRNALYSNMPTKYQPSVAAGNKQAQNILDLINRTYNTYASNYQTTQANNINQPLLNQYNQNMANYNQLTGQIGNINKLLQGTNINQLAPFLKGGL